MKNINDYNWYQKYRPDNVDDAILPDRIKNIIISASRGTSQSYVLHSESGGTGKTTTAYLFANAIGCSAPLKINASGNRGIDAIRDTVFNYVSKVSSLDDFKVVILDEADGLTQDARKCLKSMIEECSEDVCFIITTNDLNVIDGPLQSRCIPISFEWNKQEQLEMTKGIIKAVARMLKDNGYEYDKKVLLKLATEVVPDNRKLISIVQSYVEAHGSLDEGALTFDTNGGLLDDAISVLENKDFEKSKKFIYQHQYNLSPKFLRKLYDRLVESGKLKDENEVTFIMMLNDAFDSYSRGVVDKYIFYLHFFVSVMTKVDLNG